MFESLSQKIEKAVHRLSGRSRLTEINVAEAVKDIRRALLDADVSYKVAKQFTDDVREKALGSDVLTSLQPGQVMVKIVRDEMAALMGNTASELDLKGHFNVVLMAGLQGSGKTTFTAKLANLLQKKKGKKVLLVAADVYRPAAIDQLQVLGTQIGAEVFTLAGETDAVRIAKEGVAYGRSRGFNVVLVDTAGRLAVDETLMAEIKAIHRAVEPTETLFVVDSMTGQDAVNTAKAFHDALHYTGVVLTKLDGDTRGGAALTIRAVVDVPVKFIGTGEKMEALDVFHPDRMADRILGMGDVVSLVERAQEQFNEEEARKIQKKIAQNRFGFDDFLGQIQQIKKMGNMKDLMGMIPGMSKAMAGVEVDDDAFKYIEAMIHSMTPAERTNPSLLNASRRKRIASGSGRSVEDVNKLIKQFEDMSKVMRMMQGEGGRRQMMNALKGFKG
jgi:signal recognition particle subunit SRP54